MSRYVQNRIKMVRQVWHKTEILKSY